MTSRNMARPAKRIHWTRVLSRTFLGAVSIGLAYFAFRCITAGWDNSDYMAFLIGDLFVVLAGVALHFALYPEEN